MSDKPENANPAGQGGAHVVSTENSFVTITISQLAVKYQTVSEAPKRGWMIHVEREVIDNPSLSPEARVLYAILRGYQGKNCREPFPSIKTLQSKVGVWDAIYRYLDELYRAGLIRRIKERMGGKFSRNKYEFLGPPPSSENREMVEGPPSSGLTKSVRNQVGENHIRQTASVRIPILKDSHSLKKSQEREKEIPFPSLKDAAAFFETEFPELRIKDSLSVMVSKKAWSLTETNCRRWLSIERGHRKPFRKAAKSESQIHIPRPNSEPTIEPGPEAGRLFAELIAKARLRKDGFAATGLETPIKE